MRKKQSNNTSGVPGVSYHKRYDKWYARINYNGRNYDLGYFDHVEDAERARHKAEKEVEKYKSRKK